MKFLYLRSDYVAAKAGGSLTHTREFVKALSKRATVKLIWGAHWLRFIPTRKARMIAFEVVSFIRAFCWLLLKEVDFIYERHSPYNLNGLLLSRIFSIPHILEVNGLELNMARQFRYKTGNFRLLRMLEELNLHSDHVVCVSENVREQVGRGVVIPNGVDIEKFTFKRLVVGYVGSFDTWHGIEIICAAAKWLADFDFVFIGDGRKKSWAEAYCTEYKISARFLPYVNHEVIPLVLRGCDILVAPLSLDARGHKFIGSPTKVFEYLASGKAMVVSNWGQPGKILTDGYDCLVLKENTPLELAEKIEKLTDDDLRHKLGENAKRTATKYTWDVAVSTLLQSIHRDY